MASQNKAPSKSPARIPINALLTIVGEKNRWVIFKELIKGKPLPVSEIARRAQLHPSVISKHMMVLHRNGIVERGFGHLYEIAERFKVPGEATLDFGPVVLRLDQSE